MGLITDILDLTSLIPKQFGAHTRALSNALDHFVGRLPTQRRANLLSEQAAMPASTHPAIRLVTLMHACPVLHKLGQVIARDRRLDPTLANQLQTLEARLSLLTADDARRLISHELGDIPESIQLTPDEQPGIIEGSVAVVIPARIDNAPSVLKLLKPSVTDKLEHELLALRDVGHYLDEQTELHRLPRIDYRDTFDQVARLLQHEVRFDSEQAHLEKAAHTYRHSPDVHIPALLEPCTRRLTAMERVDGVKVTDAATSRRSIAERITRALIAHPIWSDDDDALFHADPHAGNLIATPDDTLGILDWSLAATLDRESRQRIVQMVIGAVTFDPARIACSIAAMAANTPVEPALRNVTENAVARFRRGEQPIGLKWLTQLLDDAFIHARVRFAPELTMLRKALLTLDGVVHDIDPTCNADGIIAGLGLSQFAGEWWTRPWSTPWNRNHPTHVSNADLAAVMFSAPATATRYWMGLLGDAIGNVNSRK